MVGGQIHLSQLSDKALILALEARDNQPGLTLTQGQITGGSGQATAIISWRDLVGLKAAAALLHKLAELP
jgi:hypothetical protein